MKPGDIVLVKFPFSDLQNSKKRPALVLKSEDINTTLKLVTIAMITSKIDGLQLKGDYKIKNWKDIGLLFPSLIRFSKIATIEGDLVEKTIGELRSSDIKSSKSIFKNHFKFWT